MTHRGLLRLAMAAATGIAMAACHRDVTPLQPDLSIQQPVLCQENPWLCVPVDGTIHDGTGNGTVAAVPDDPSPGANGIWLGNYVSSRYCYANYNRFANDQISTGSTTIANSSWQELSPRC